MDNARGISCLADTAEMMASEDYKVRFKAEWIQLKMRYEKLKDFCNRIEAAEITGKDMPPHDCPLYVLREQQNAMGLYLHSLEVRAYIEGVELV